MVKIFWDITSVYKLSLCTSSCITLLNDDNAHVAHKMDLKHDFHTKSFTYWCVILDNISWSYKPVHNLSFHKTSQISSFNDFNAFSARSMVLNHIYQPRLVTYWFYNSFKIFLQWVHVINSESQIRFRNYVWNYQNAPSEHSLVLKDKTHICLISYWYYIINKVFSQGFYGRNIRLYASSLFTSLNDQNALIRHNLILKP